ncbi:putative ABC transporter permease YknZ [Gemmata obscuriglobus]|uniref:ABC transporter permease n=1 Tax=Gemmata obscuriglobus TaxID=114 RepID=A0A2Z3GWA4_9BACT|nr:ABC transporter permease [Gemmata obscuriglobus]AWM36372.1 ABC transporter permease [Gemmata obscuriglobus]QEG31016.1 putative ABC transporter permease YknZ [Gemmata obscuriglobus]VTS10351.1 abc transporter permease protein : ABC-type transport system, involved in lipoprotein release, permease component OS=Singulisphaera acidiphila (strain ATCC BAA-1392 / DSM 18658 / VKM B-2454 / MOB10) GN=Sinac_5571 PE=4 SV=1: MacB_PCD: FtsX [Gemmata obscuriglobus UQM 2246]
MYFAAFILKNLTRRPVRTALTVLGLAVTVGSMIALLAVSHNVERSVESAFDTRRVDLVVLQANKPLGLDSDFREYMVEQVRSWTDVVDRVSEGVVSTANTIRDSGSVNENTFLVQGWKPDNFGFEDMALLSGEMLKAEDTHKIMLGEKRASAMGKKVGDTVTFVADPEHPYTVVAVYKSPVVFEDGGAIVPFADGQALTGKRVTGFSIRVKRGTADGAAEIAAVQQRVADLRDPKDPTARLDAQPPDKYVQSVSQLKLIKAVSWLVSAIAFAVGTITMLNTMAMSVLERTHEIGILRAVGWPRSRVIRMILGEAAMIALGATTAGLLIAFVGMQSLTLSPKVNGFIEPDLSLMVILEGAAITLLIGLIGGAYPAYRAARLLPTEALRHD